MGIEADIEQLKTINGILLSIVKHNISPHVEKLLDDVLHCDDKPSDIIINCSDGVVTAQKWILCKRSQVFNAMLTSGYRESSGTINMQNYISADVQMFIDYISWGKIPHYIKKSINLEYYTSANILMELADMYEMNLLIRELTSYIFGNLSEEIDKQLESWKYGDLIIAGNTSDEIENLKLKINKKFNTECNFSFEKIPNNQDYLLIIYKDKNGLELTFRVPVPELIKKKYEEWKKLKEERASNIRGHTYAMDNID